MSRIDERVVQAPRARRWSPEGGIEAAEMLRLLALRPWLVAGRDDEAIAKVRRNITEIRAALARLGWALVVERDLVRLRKSAPVRRTAWCHAPRKQGCVKADQRPKASGKDVDVRYPPRRTLAWRPASAIGSTLMSVPERFAFCMAGCTTQKPRSDGV